MRAKPATLHALQHQLDLLEAAISGVYAELEEFAERFVPRGAGEMLPPLPDALDLEATADEDIAMWDKKRPKERGLLDAGEAA